MDFYERLETLRKKENISQKQLEMALGFSNGSISKWKNHTPTIERLQKLSDYFGVSIEYLLCETDDPNEGHKEFGSKIPVEDLVMALNSMGITAGILDKPRILTDRERRLLEYFRLLSGEMQDKLLDLTEATAKSTQQNP